MFSKLNKLDNKTSDILHQFMDKEHFTLQLVPPYFHRQNTVERVIRTFKDYIIVLQYGTNSGRPD